MLKAIIDTSSTILLYKAALFKKIILHYSLIISRGVFSELNRSGYEGAEFFSSLVSQPGVSIISMESDLYSENDGSLKVLGTGERESILLFKEGYGDFIILDDRKGAAYCRKSGIPYINALLAVRLLHLNRALNDDEFQRSFDLLTRIGHYSNAIIDYALNCHPDQLEYFIKGKEA